MIGGGFNWPVFAVGMFTVAMWCTGAVYAYWVKRGFLLAGFSLAGLVSVVSSVVYAGGSVAVWLSTVAAWTRPVVAALIVLSLVANNPRARTGRPSTRWRP